MTNVDERQFVCGIGAAKAGTTWLYQYLAARSEVYLSPLKEMHYFDAKYRPSLSSRFDDDFKKRLQKNTVRFAIPGTRSAKHKPHIRERVRMISSPEAYREYFEKFTPESCSVFGEITPAYALLDEEGFAAVARIFPKAKLIFLLRDPAQRFYSHFCMWERKGRVSSERLGFFREALNVPDLVERTTYHTTLENVLRVFPENQVHIGFYETLFSDAEIARLCNFLSIPFKPADYQKKSNAAPHKEAIDAELMTMAVERFAPTYAYCSNKFGERVPRQWGAV